MSSSSSDSDSDDFEPIRRIKINIRPKDDVVKRDGADINEIKASVEAWRPLGPPPHPSLTRRQSSMSSMSSLSFGVASNYGGSSSATSASLAGFNQFNQANSRGNMRSSPSCSSLVNEFNNRSSFTNFMSTTSRTSSPLTLMGNYGDTVPIAIAIQESIELTVKGQNGPTIGETKFETRALGNIKVAFPNAFAQKCATTITTTATTNGNDQANNNNNNPILKLRMHSTENIIRYYASRLIKDLDLGTKNNNQQTIDAFKTTKTTDHNNGITTKLDNNDLANHKDLFTDLFDLEESPVKGNLNSSRLIEFDMPALSNHLKQLYEKSPNFRYYNVDVLRYQIAPPQEFEQCPLQVCAYWKCEPKLTKLRIDFKHSNKCGLNLERLRDIRFCVDLANFIPAGLDVSSLSPDSLLSVRLNNNNNDSISLNMNANQPTLTTNSFHSTTQGSIFPLMQTPSTTHRQAPITTNYLNETVAKTNTQHQKQQQQQSVYQKQITNSNNTHATSSNLANQGSSMMVRLPPPPSRGNTSTTMNTLNRTTSTLNKSDAFSAFAPPTHHTNLKQTQQQSHTTPLFNQPQQTSPNAAFHQSSLASFGDNISIASSSSSSSSSTRPSQRIMSSLFGNNHIQQQQHHHHKSHQLIDTDPPVSCNTANDFVSPGGTTTTTTKTTTMPFITFEPHAHWNSDTKQLTWKFDNLLSYYKTDGYGSLLAKLDFRNYHHHEMLPLFAKQPEQQRAAMEPSAIDVKFMVVDSTLSKVNMSIDTTGYRMSLLKKEIRSGRYKSEPYVF